MDLCGDEMSLSDSAKRQRAWALRREGYLKGAFDKRMDLLEKRLTELEVFFQRGPK